MRDEFALFLILPPLGVGQDVSSPWLPCGPLDLPFATRLVVYHLGKNVSMPKPGSGQALVRVFGSSVNPVNVDLVEPVRGSFRCSARTSGTDIAGVVVAVSKESRYIMGQPCSSRWFATRYVHPTIRPCCRVRNACEFSYCHSRLVPSSGKSADCVSTLESVRRRYGSLKVRRWRHCLDSVAVYDQVLVERFQLHFQHHRTRQHDRVRASCLTTRPCVRSETRRNYQCASLMPLIGAWLLMFHFVEVHRLHVCPKGLSLLRFKPRG